MSDSKITIKKLPRSKVQFEVEVTPEIIAKYKDVALQKLSEETDLKGFRAGHVPVSLLEQHYGAEYVQARVVDIAFPYLYADVVRQEKLAVLAQPEVKIVKETPLVIEVIVAVFPEVEIGSYQKIKISKKEVKISSKEVEEVLAQIKQRNAKYKIKESEAQKGDRVEINFEGEFTTGVKDDRLRSKHHPLILGSNSFIPGFEDQIIGMKKGDQKTFEIGFPKNYHHQEFQNKKATFTVEIVEVEEIELPEINEDFIQKLTGKKSTVEEFVKDVEENLRVKMEQDIYIQRENELMDKITEITQVDIPEILIKEEVDFMLHDLKQKITSQGMDFSHYLQHLKKSENELRKEYEKQAQKRILLRFAFQEIIKKEQLQVSEEEMIKKIEEIKAGLPKKDQYTVGKDYKKGSKAYSQLENRLKLDKVIEMLLNQ
jgi:trigger factor